MSPTFAGSNANLRSSGAIFLTAVPPATSPGMSFAPAIASTNFSAFAALAFGMSDPFRNIVRTLSPEEVRLAVFLLIVYGSLRWFAAGGRWRLLTVMAAMGFLSSETPVAFLLPVLFAAAYLGAFALRFDFGEPRWGWSAVAASFLTVCAVYVVLLLVCGCYRHAWRRFSLRDLPRYAAATFLACVALTLVRYFTPVDEYLNVRPPYSITVISFVLSFVGLIGGMRKLSAVGNGARFSSRSFAAARSSSG